MPGVVGIFAGAVSRFNGRWQLTHPEYEILGSDLDGWDVSPEGRLDTVSRLDAYREHRIPVYSETGNAAR